MKKSHRWFALQKNVLSSLVLSAALVTANMAFASLSDSDPLLSSSSTAYSTDDISTDKADEYFSRGLYKEAIRQWRVAYKTFQAQGDLSGQILVLYKIATAQRQMGLHDRAIRGLEVANQLLTLITSDQGINELQIIIKANLAGAYLYAGQIEQAKPLLQEARNSAEKNGRYHLAALIYNDFGNLYGFAGQPDKALQAFAKSRELAEKVGDSELVVQALTNSVLLASEQNKADIAVRDLQSALDAVEQIEPSFEKARASLNLGMATFELLQRQQLSGVAPAMAAVKLLDRQIGYARQLDNDWLVAKLLMQQALFYEFAGQLDDALALAKKATFHAQLIDDNNLTYQLQWQVARINKQTNNDDEAATYYRRAIETLQPIRHLLVDRPFTETALESRQGNLYLEFADLLLRHAADENSRDTTRDLLVEARNVLERQKSEELQDYFKNQCVVEAQSRTIAIDEAIDEHTAVIYPVLLPDRTELLVSYHSGIKQYVVDIPEPAVTKQVRQLRLKLEKRRTRDYLPYAEKLYRVLVSPLEQDLKQREIKTLVFIPGQSLRTIPVSVLHDGNEFLVEKYAVATTPGLTLTDPRPLKRQNMKVLLSGLSEPVQGYPPLDYVPGELEQIRNLYGATLLLNQGFVNDSITDELQDTGYNVAHFASHAQFSGDVRESFILTFDDRLSVSQLGQFATMGQYKNKPIELLTLSACNTAAGDDRAALGLAGVAVQSGARSALASLWAINDKASSLLVTEFYRQLHDEHVTKAEALQRAQQKLMQNVRYRHPGYWSPFLLIGNWL
jgi:CHAT domain-containing protein/tetratricopeptide (TPR) repeat protein